MFGLGLKERSGEALRRGAKAIVLGSFYQHSQAEEHGLNERATAFLYSEALAHQLYALGQNYGLSLVGKHKWATPEFFLRNVAGILIDQEREQQLPPGALSEVLLNRFMDFEQMSPQDRKDGRHFKQSATLVAERDSSANAAIISKSLEQCSRSFFDQARKVFEK